jgi:proline iminopeptidase
MKKMIGLIILILLAVLLVVAAVFWWSMGQPRYLPGNLRAVKILAPPQTPASAPAVFPAAGIWTMEPGIQLHYFSRGTGRPVLVMHGGPGVPFGAPIPALDLLTNRFQFYYYDQRGCGDSSRPFDRFASHNYHANMVTLESGLGIGTQLADLERIRQILGQEKLIVIGHSFGGFLASMYAAEFPEHVESLVLVAPADTLVFPRKDGFFTQIRQRLPAARQAEFDAFLAQYLNFGRLFTRSEAEWSALNLQAGKYFLEAADKLSDPAFRDRPPKIGGWMVQAMYLSMGRRHDYRAALQRVTAPVLVLHGADDILPESGSRQYVESLPHARLEVISGKSGKTSHFLFSDQPELFGRAVEAFLTNAAPAGGVKQ